MVWRATVVLATIMSLALICQGTSFENGMRITEESEGMVSYWLTTGDRKYLLAPLTLPLGSNTSSSPSLETIRVDPQTTSQNIQGFGFCLTGASADLIMGLEAGARKQLLMELFGSSDSSSIGISFLRLSLGASDLSTSVFSYDMVPEDWSLSSFSLGPDLTNVVPALQEILLVNPDIQLLASPWSPPVWLKTNNYSVGGSLFNTSQVYTTYAQYFVKYIQAMASQGITIHYVTVQNEPLNPNNNPSLLMEPDQQALFVGSFMGPAFQRAGITTKIVIYDHNPDRIDYPLQVLSDPNARQYIDGSAFHLYAGSIDSLSVVHDTYPDKNIYFTEQWVGAPSDFGPNLLWGVSSLIIGGTRNWCRIVLEWNLASDPTESQHTPGGCFNCLGGITIDDNTTAITRNEGYYIIGHASKFVPAGSVHVDSTASTSVVNTAFVTPQGSITLVVANPSSDSVSFNVQCLNNAFSPTLPPQSVATFTWVPTSN